MKKQMMKLTAAAALVLGMASAAHAAGSTAALNISGAVTASQCQVLLNGGSAASTVLDPQLATKITTAAANLTNLVAPGNVVVATLAGCGDMPQDSSAYLLFTGQKAPSTGSQAGDFAAFSDSATDVGYGYALRAEVTAGPTDFNATPGLVEYGDSSFTKSAGAANTLQLIGHGKVTAPLVGTEVDKFQVSLTPAYAKVGTTAPKPGASSAVITVSFVSSDI